MANVLRFDLRCKVIAHLVEGTSIRSTGRLCGVDKDAVMRFGVVVGLACLTLHARLVRRVQMAMGEVDEVWAYVGRHERRKLPKDPPEFGDNYTMFCLDPVTKLVPAFLTGPRDLTTATRFACALRAATVGKPQINVDGWPHWPDAFRRAFGWNGVDLAVVIKEYQNEGDPRDPGRRYSPGRIKSMDRHRALGMPNLDEANTSMAERLNLTTRMHQRRLTRLTNAYSKKQENLAAAVGLHFFWYNFVRVHDTIGTTPAVAAGLADAPWSIADLVAAALEVAAESASPEPTPPAPSSPEPPPAPMPTWETWREPVQLPLPGVDPANDNGRPAEEAVEDDAPATVRDPIPWGEGVAL